VKTKGEMTMPEQQNNREQLPKRKHDTGSGKPGDGAGRVDVVGQVPADVHPDPNITEGHPGYQESGGSELRPPRTSGK